MHNQESLSSLKFLKYQTQESPSGISTGRASLKMAATYSPTVTQYHRRDEA